MSLNFAEGRPCSSKSPRRLAPLRGRHRPAAGRSPLPGDVSGPGRGRSNYKPTTFESKKLLPPANRESLVGGAEQREGPERLKHVHGRSCTASLAPLDCLYLIALQVRHC